VFDKRLANVYHTEMRATPEISKHDVQKLVRQNTRVAKSVWLSRLSAIDVDNLVDLTRRLQISISRGELQYIDNKWYVTHAGLLRVARDRRCVGIRTTVQRNLCDPVTNRWVFRAIVYTARGSRGFVGYGDADTSNVSPLVRGAEMRVAETRAVNRALRKAYGIGLCSVEELGWSPRPPEPSHPNQAKPFKASGNGHHNGNGQPRLRDQLCLLIRQYNLDPSLVKSYAADFCGTATLKEASRDLVESFISQLSASAKENRDALVCKLNSYAPHREVNS
jgi:hypothetical protein